MLNVECCYENFQKTLMPINGDHAEKLPFVLKPKSAALLDRTADFPQTRKNFICLDSDIVVYPLPDNLHTLDFARFMIQDENFVERDEPFYLVDLSRLLAQHQSWIQNLPRVEPFYAVKCNNHKILLKMLAALGCCFDCASKGEIESVLDVGVSADRIIYANPCKTSSYIKHAAARNVEMMTFDCEQELFKIVRLYPEAKLVLRIAISDPTAVCPLNLKFGCEPGKSAVDLLKLAASLKAKVIGVSFHVGSGCRDPTAFAFGIEYARELFDLGYQLGLDMHLLDLGGGFPGYKNALSFETVSDVINRALSLHFPEESEQTLVGTFPSNDYSNNFPLVGRSPLRIIAEPGRFYAASCFTLCCTVVAKRQVTADRITKDANDQNEAGFMYYINDGVYGSFNCILYDHVNPPGAPLKPFCSNSTALYKTAVWGPTCDSLDLVEPVAYYPEMFEGQWVAYENMGAYTYAAGSEFNGFPRPPCCYFVSQSDEAILKALFKGRTARQLSDERGFKMTTSSSFGFLATLDQQVEGKGTPSAMVVNSCEDKNLPETFSDDDSSSTVTCSSSMLAFG